MPRAALAAPAGRWSSTRTADSARLELTGRRDSAAGEEATMIVVPPTLDEAEGHVAEMYESDLRHDGFVFSHTQAMAINSEAHQAFESLVRAIVPSIGVRTYELATLAAARAIPSPHCLLA